MSEAPLHPDEFRKTFAALREELGRVIVAFIEDNPRA